MEEIWSVSSIILSRFFPEGKRHKTFIYIFPSLIFRWRPAHTGETEDEDHEPFSADAECGAAERQSPKGPGRGWTAGGREQGARPTGEETVKWQKQIWSEHHQWV